MRSIGTLGLWVTILALAPASSVMADEVKIVAWNMQSHFIERVQKRTNDFVELNNQLSPDVLVITEIVGLQEAKAIAEVMGWKNYWGAISNVGTASQYFYEGQEFFILSKIPIENVVEFDVSKDGTHETFSNVKEYKSLKTTEKSFSTKGMDHLNELEGRDRLTLRVDLENGLSIFPVHLKSNRNNECFNVRSAIETFEKLSMKPPKKLVESYNSGFDLATKRNISNALKRERVMASLVMLAEEAIKEGRIPVIAGDFNTSYEPGKKGNDLAKDCALKDFSCEKAPFPEAACAKGDGFDDTLAILENGYTAKKGVKGSTWKVLSEGLKSSYDDDAFSDLAIDHIAVPTQFEAKFRDAELYDGYFGSDHKPVFTVFQAN